MPYEVDFLPVGEGERSGDAIALRYVQDDRYVIHVIDGGDQTAGENLVEHIKQEYGNPRFIDHVVLTHPDNDHSSGLREVINAFNVGTIWANLPWRFAPELLASNSFRDQRFTLEGLVRRLRDDFPILAEIEKVAAERNIAIKNAFQGTKIGAFTVLSPARARYLQLVPHFEKTPAAASPPPSALGIGGIFSGAARAATTVLEWVQESLGKETLTEPPEPTSATNETSVVQIANLDGHVVALTGDAGVVSLHEAADAAPLYGYTLPRVRFIQIPHHGSRRNVSPSVLDRWLGPKLGVLSEERNVTAVASAAKDSDTHPRKKVVNAFIRRGAKVLATQGKKLCHYHGTPSRPGWGPATPLDFSDRVEP